MKRKIWPGFFVLLTVLLLAAWARPAYPVVSLRASPQPALTPTFPQPPSLLRVAVAAILSPRTTYHVYENLAAYLEERLGEPVEVTQRATYAETNELIRIERMGRLALFTALVCFLTALLFIWFDLGMWWTGKSSRATRVGPRGCMPTRPSGWTRT